MQRKIPAPGKRYSTWHQSENHYEILKAGKKCNGLCLYSYRYRNITFSDLFLFSRVTACILTTSSSSPLVLGPWLCSWCGQLARWDFGVCAQLEICPGHHGSAHWHLVPPCVCVCVCVCVFVSGQLNHLWRKAAAEKYRVTPSDVFLSFKNGTRTKRRLWVVVKMLSGAGMHAVT